MKILKVLMVIILLFVIVFSCTKVPAGNVGVKVYLLGSEKGVDTEELGVGRYYIGINEELYLFPTFQQNYIWTKDKNEGSPNDESFTFQTSEGLGVNADVGISYHLNPKKISSVFQKYRKGIEEITDVFMRNYVRDAFNNIGSQYPVESVYGKGKTQLIQKVQDKISPELEEQGIIIDKLYWIGTIRLPDVVEKALNAKIEATQRAEQRENELREAEAEAAKKIAIAQGEAQANKIRLSTINKTLIEYEQMQNQKEAIKKWDGKLPNVTSGVVPFIQIESK